MISFPASRLATGYGNPLFFCLDAKETKNQG
jgi:hypothetical protein